jgi:hypothetical protein
MTAIDGMPDDSRYARSIQSSKRVYWDIDDDVIRGRRFDVAHKFLPDGLSLANTFTTLSPNEKRFVSQIQGALTPISLGWSSGSSMPKSWSWAAITRLATRRQSKRWCDSARRS